MFKKRSLQVSVVKTPRKPQTETPADSECCHVTIVKINNLIEKNVVRTAVAAVAVYASVVVLNTASEIAINYAPKN